MSLFQAITGVFAFYISSLVIHNVLLMYFYLVRYKTGARAILTADHLAFHYNLKEPARQNKQAPLIVFESSIGYGMSCWEHISSQISELPTLSYDRAGYGIHSLIQDGQKS